MRIQTFRGKTALVTGSTSGIGLSIARSLARQGADILLNGLGEPQAIEAIRNELAESNDVRCAYHGADMEKADEIESMIRFAHEKFGGVDILVNNAGIQFVSSIVEFPPEKWDTILAINLTAAFHTTRLALPHMLSKNWGRIVNISSAHGLIASANKSAYIAAKHGMVGLTKATALETAASGVTCNAICPGWVLTPLVQAQVDMRAQQEGLSDAEMKKRMLSEKQPSGEFVSTEQIGDTVAFLCSAAADQIRGISLPIDGGIVAQ
jgi:3-hydroxybutyrate dehydrogenase